MADRLASQPPRRDHPATSWESVDPYRPRIRERRVLRSLDLDLDARERFPAPFRRDRSFYAAAGLCATAGTEPSALVARTTTIYQRLKTRECITVSSRVHFAQKPDRHD
jgi:hypothetical protein